MNTKDIGHSEAASSDVHAMRSVINEAALSAAFHLHPQMSANNPDGCFCQLGCFLHQASADIRYLTVFGWKGIDSA